MLAVVHHQEQGFGMQEVGDCLHQRPMLFSHAHRGGDGLRHQRRVSERFQLHQPDAVLVGLQEFGGHLQGETCLPRAAGTRQGHQAVCREVVFHGCDLAFSADKAGQLDG